MDPLESKKNSDKDTFISHFSEIVDTRDPIRKRYPLTEVLFLVVSSVLSGYESNRNIEEFGYLKLDWLRQYFDYTNGIPTHETIGNVIGMIDKKVFESCFSQWVSTQYGIDHELVHIDGKRISSSVDKMLQDKKPEQGGSSAELLLNAYASEKNVVVAQINVTDSGDEKQGAKQLIEQLDLKGKTITGDGNFCTKEILKHIKKNGGDYMMTLKRNQPKLYKICEQLFDEYPADQSTHKTADNDHGRYEYRTYVSLSTQLFDIKKFEEYEGICQLVKVNRHRIERRNNKRSRDVHYYVTSSAKEVKDLAVMIRSHWSVENNLHWVLDVEFEEDASRKRSGNQASNFSLIRKIALNLINQHRGRKSIKGWRMACAVSDKTRENTLGFS